MKKTLAGWFGTMGIIRLIIRGMGEFSSIINLAALICLADQLFKHSIDGEPEDNFPRELPHSDGKVLIRRAHNPGFSQGHFGSMPEFVKYSSLGLSCALFGALHAFCRAFPGKRIVEKLGAGIMLGGAASNTYDRIAHGVVTDYIHVQKGPLKNSIINIGDIAIVGGGLIYATGALVSMLRRDE